MSASYDGYIEQLMEPESVYVLKVELLDDQESVIQDITNDYIDGSGSLNVTLQNGSRRSASISLMNIDNKYTPKSKGLIWLNKKIKISCGIMVNNEDYLISQGIFCINEPEAQSYFTDTTVSINLTDKWSYLDGTLRGVLATDYVIPVGSNIGDAVRAIILNEVKDVKQPIIIPTNIVSPYTLTMNRGDNYGDLLIKLAEMISYECFYDKNGHFRFQPVQDDTKRPSVWDFSRNETTYLGSTRKFGFNEIKNSVYVYGDNINGDQALGSAKDTYIFSDTNVDIIGERVKVIEDDKIYSDDLAQQRAVYELGKAVMIQESISLECVPVYHFDCNDIVTIEDEGNDLQRERYIISGYSLSLDVSSSMTIDVWKSRPLE